MTTETQKLSQLVHIFSQEAFWSPSAGSAKLPEAQGQFPDTLPAFIIGTLAAAIGIFLCVGTKLSRNSPTTTQTR